MQVAQDKSNWASAQTSADVGRPRSWRRLQGRCWGATPCSFLWGGPGDRKLKCSACINCMCILQKDFVSNDSWRRCFRRNQLGSINIWTRRGLSGKNSNMIGYCFDYGSLASVCCCDMLWLFCWTMYFERVVFGIDPWFRKNTHNQWHTQELSYGLWGVGTSKSVCFFHP